MKDTLISFETAKLAREKGVHLSCIEGYEPDTGEHTLTLRSDRNDILDAPTQSLLQKWLREQHGIHVWLIPAEVDHSYRAYIGHGIKLDLLACESTMSFPTYEETLERGLQEALKLIET